MSDNILTRRQAFDSVASAFAGALPAGAQGAAADRPVRLAPRAELLNTFEFEQQAKLKLPRAVFTAITGSDRQPFDRITLRPRVVVDCMDLNLTSELFGQTMFAPILVGPVARQREYHPEAELATVRGASAAKAVMVVSSWSSEPIDRIAAQAKTPLWYQVFLDAGVDDARARIQKAVDEGCKAICINPTTPTSSPGAPAPMDWAFIDAARKGLAVPVLVKGVMTIADAREAVKRDVGGIIVSNGSQTTAGAVSPIDVLPRIVDAVAGKMPVLVDGGFRRGADILKALALGAKAVLVARPVMWGLAAYGADGVQSVVELLQTDLARMMAGCGKPSLRAIDRTVVKVHAPAAAPRRRA